MMSRLERFFYLAFIAVLIFSFSRERPSKAALMTSFEDGFANVAEKVSPVVVNISAEGTAEQTPLTNPFKNTPFEQFFHQFFAPQFSQHFTSLGSGMVVRENGYILTNAHVIRGMDKISVILSDGKTYRKAKLVGTDPRVDLAVIKIEPEGSLPTGILGNSDKIRIGEWAVAIGNPYGFKSTVTVGVISAKERNLPGESEATYHNLIQTDASINPGNSGGALVDINGDIIGMNTSIATPTGGSVGIGFAIPINTIKSELNELISEGRVVHGYLGVYTQPLTPELQKAFGVSSGVLLADIIPSSPAAKSGLRRGDVILKYDQHEIDSPESLQDAVTQTHVGSVVPIEIMRGKQPLTLRAKIDELPSLQSQTSKSAHEYWGLHLKAITPAIAQTYGLHETSGVLVTAVDPDSMAAMAQISAGDVLREVNHKPVASLEQFEKAIQGNQTDTVLLLVEHQGTFRYVALGTRSH